MAFQEWPSQGHTPSLSCTSAHLNFIQQPTPSVTHWTWNRMISKTQYFHAGKVQARCQAWCRTCMHEICREPQRTSNFLWIWKCSENAWIISEDPQQRLPWDVLGRLGAFWTFWDVLHVEQVLMVLHWCSKVLPELVSAVDSFLPSNILEPCGEYKSPRSASSMRWHAYNHSHLTTMRWVIQSTLTNSHMATQLMQARHSTKQARKHACKHRQSFHQSSSFHRFISFETAERLGYNGRIPGVSWSNISRSL
jgi:hypothetical protein